MQNRRINGLDTLRALAITLVFMYHYKVFVSHEATFGWASIVGWVGVDLFFVLSGYLIGNQLFSGLVRGEILSLKFFYARRALRTWPVFWIVLAAYFLFPSVMGGKEPPPLWRFLSFTQNYQLQSGTAFSHAWSLCIEEQFYLVLPLVLVIGLRIGSGRTQAWCLLAALLVLGITARAILWFSYGLIEFGQLDAYQPNIYYSTLCRFDEFLPGIAVAMLKNFHPRAWQRIMVYGHSLFATGLAATALMLFCAYRFYYIKDYGYGFFMTVLGYSLIAMVFAVLVAAVLSPTSLLQRVRIPGAYHLALWSYSIYLSHKAVGNILQQYAKQYALSPSLMLLSVTTASIGVGVLLYKLVEKPFMDMRERYFPNTFKTPAYPVAPQPSMAD